MITGAILLLLGIAIGYFSKSSVTKLSPKIEARVNKLVGRNQASIVDMGFIDLGIENE